MSQIDPKLIEKKRSMEQDLSEAAILNDIDTIHSIYFDLVLLQDVYIGALLLHSKNEEEYNKILLNLPIYQSRIDTDVCKYFPFMENINDEYLFNFIRTTPRQDLLYKSSLHTSLWMFIPKLMEIIINKDRIVNGYDGFHCDFYINLYPTNYTPEICKLMNRHFKKITSGISLKTVNMPFVELPEYVRNLPKMYFIEDIGTLASTNSPIFESFYKNDTFDNKYIFSKKIISNNKLEVPIVESFEKTKYFMNMFTTFDYVDIYFPGIQYIPSYQPEQSNDKIVHQTT